MIRIARLSGGISCHFASKTLITFPPFSSYFAKCHSLYPSLFRESRGQLSHRVQILQKHRSFLQKSTMSTVNDEDVGFEAVPVLIELDDSLKGRLVSDLAAICDVTEEVAREMLIANKWNMQNSIDKFLDGEQDEQAAGESGDDRQTEGASEIVSPVADVKKEKSSEIEKSTDNFSTWAPEKLSMISWNLDGLDDHNLEKRTNSVVALIEKDQYDIIFFQELIPPTFEFIARKLSSNYMPIPGTEDSSCDYLTGTFLRLNRVHYKDHYIVPFPNTAMGRNLLVTEAFAGQAKLYLLNTHLESTAEFATERVAQLKSCFELIRSFPKEYTVIFGGDLNVRDKEVAPLVPSNVSDLWIQCGSRKSCEYTWDLTRNTNKRMPSQYQPRLRFDRFYFRESNPQAMMPEFFGVTGIEKVSGTQSFPSDHWAIITFLRLSKEARKPAAKKRKAEESESTLAAATSSN